MKVVINQKEEDEIIDDDDVAIAIEMAMVLGMSSVSQMVVATI